MTTLRATLPFLVLTPRENTRMPVSTGIIGTVADNSGYVQSYTLSIAPLSTGEFRQIASGLGQVENGTLATLGTTTLQILWSPTYLALLASRTTDR